MQRQPTVHILATCRKPELIEATTMVFKTLRVGFPTALILVHGNGLTSERDSILDCALEADCEYVDSPTVTHFKWIEDLVTNLTLPFWICDTDMAFWSSVEDWDLSHTVMAGRYLPDFRDPFTQSITMARPHTSLLYFNPLLIRGFIDRYRSEFKTDLPWEIDADLFRPLRIPKETPWGDPRFYDTLAMLSRVVPCMAFTGAQLNCYDHLNCGTYLDLVDKAHPGLRNTFEAAKKDINSMRGLWRRQQEYYLAQKPR